MAFQAAKGLSAAMVPPTKQEYEAMEGDPIRKYSLQEETHPGIRERTWGLDARTDSSVTFEEFVYWAKVERDLEREENRIFKERRGKRTIKNTIMGRFSKGVHHDNAKRAAAAKEGRDEKTAVDATSSPLGPDTPTSNVAVTDAEWRTAARALRTASWGGVFFLITTDILGWSGCPFVFASVGYGLGVALYIIFGLAAGFSGFVIWRTFLGLDSSRFPMLSFGDPFLRVFGPKSRHFINVMQCIQMFLTVAVLVYGNAQVLIQVIDGQGKNKICFTLLMFIIMIIGLIVGNIRSLQRLGWLCNLAVWLNVASFIIICYAATYNAIDYVAVENQSILKKTPKTTPVQTFVGIPPDYLQLQVPGFAATFNAVDSMVYAYSGALLFVAFLAEMRHPLDFWKGVFIAQAFICFVYMFFGAYVYSQYGQWSASSISQVVTPYALQTVGNVMGLITGLIAIVLYFNIGMKTVYIEVFQELLHFPPIITKKGKICWMLLGPIYWALAFIFAAGVPNLNTIVDLVGGLFSLNFTYSIPSIMYLGYRVQLAAALPGEGFDPVTGVTVRHDAGMKRWVRGYFKDWYVSIPVTLYTIGGLACSGMGTWAAVEGAISVFGPGGTKATPFGCASPV